MTLLLVLPDIWSNFGFLFVFFFSMLDIFIPHLRFHYQYDNKEWLTGQCKQSDTKWRGQKILKHSYDFCPWCPASGLWCSCQESVIIVCLRGTMSDRPSWRVILWDERCILWNCEEHERQVKTDEWVQIGRGWLLLLSHFSRVQLCTTP